MHKQIGINRAFCNFLVETFEFTDKQLEALDYRKRQIFLRIS